MTQPALTAMPSLPMRTERLVLRHYRDDDVDAFHAIYGHPVVATFLLTDPLTREESEQQIAKRLLRRHIDGPEATLALVVELEGAMIGEVGLWPVHDSLSIGEIGGVFSHDHGGHGYATEAATAILALAFEHYGMHRVKGQLDSRNVASVKLCERLGMTREAHLRRDWWSKGEWTDTTIYAMLREEWEARRDHSAAGISDTSK